MLLPEPQKSAHICLSERTRLAQATATLWVVKAKMPGIMGGDACIANTRLPVWLFVSLRHQGATDAELFNTYPQLTAADSVNVWAYAEAYPGEIETALQEQEEAMHTDL
jgi:uncharacterized protein (DUF433 family)